jgi:hypothetical protein
MRPKSACLRLLWLLPALGSVSCTYSPPVAVLPPPAMVIENRPKAEAVPKEKSPVRDFQPIESISNKSQPQPQQPAEGDELARIEDLQRRGVITEQEAQKLKLRLQTQEQPEAGLGAGPSQKKETKSLWELSPRERALELLN